MNAVATLSLSEEERGTGNGGIIIMLNARTRNVLVTAASRGAKVKRTYAYYFP